MARTLLQAVNRVMRRTNWVGPNDPITSLTESGRQNVIDGVVDAINAVVRDVYDLIPDQRPTSISESSLTLVTNDRDYALDSDLERLYWPLIQQTNGYEIWPYRSRTPGLSPYQQMWRDQPIPSQWTGRPYFAAFEPVAGELYLDRIPTANENGEVYAYTYDKSLTLSTATDTFPFSDEAMLAIEEAAADYYSVDKKAKNPVKYAPALARAAGLISKTPIRASW